jgi:hypothetical protein
MFSIPSNRPLLLFFLTAILGMSCDHKSKVDEIVLAEVFEHKLTLNQISDQFKKGIEPQDSLKLLNQIVDKWINERLLISKAELNLSDSEKNFEEQLTNYKNSLLIYAYESKLITEKLDTVISEKEIQNFYAKHKNNFKLKDDIVKVIYMKVEKTLSNLDKVENLFKKHSEENIAELEEFASKYATNYLFDENSWLFFNDLIKEVPLEFDDSKNFLEKNTFVKLEDEYFFYYLTFLEYKLKQSISLLSMERNKITELIINNRKNDLIKNMRNDIVNQAFNQRNAKKYVDAKF